MATTIIFYPALFIYAQDESVEENKEFIPSKEEIKNAEDIRNFIKSPNKGFNSKKYVGKSVVIQGRILKIEKDFIEIGDEDEVIWRIFYKEHSSTWHSDTIFVLSRGTVLGIKPESMTVNIAGNYFLVVASQ